MNKYNSAGPDFGYSPEYVMGLSMEEIDKQIALADRLDAGRQKWNGETLEQCNPRAALMRTQLKAERSRRLGECP